MPILTIQRRARELGRIRIGQQVPTGETRADGTPKFRPEKLDRFRITSTSLPLMRRVAELYGGEVAEWINRGSKQYEVITTATRLPILVPPQPVSQYYELWSGGGCRRRCDGETELLKDKPCVCSPDPAERECKPTTRLNVILRDVEGIGVFRLESHGYYSATELPEVAEFLARAGSYVPAWLSLEQRTVVRDGKTRRWMVPTIEVDVTPAALLAGDTAIPATQIEAARLALPAAEEPDELAQWVTEVKAATSLDGMRELWKHRPVEMLPAEAQRAFTDRAAELRAAEEPATEESAAAPSGEVDGLWMEALSAAPEDWSVADVEAHFTEITGVEPKDATTEDIRRYLDTAYPAAAEADGAA
jgi:Recombination directionality factor-like